MRRHGANRRGIRIPPDNAPGGGGPPPPPFDPSTIPDMVYWFDPSYAPNVVMGGVGVDTIYDRRYDVPTSLPAGLWALHAGGVTSRQPDVEQINGVDALRYHYEPDLDYMRVADTAITYYGTWDQIYNSTWSWTHFWVLQPMGNAGAPGNSWQTTGVMGESGYNGLYVNTVGGRLAPAGTAINFRAYYYAATAAPSNDTYASATEATGYGVATQIMGQYTNPGAAPATNTLTMHHDGVASTASGSWMWTGGQNIVQGVGYPVGPAGPRYFDGRVGEVLSFKRELTALEVSNVEGYLRTKWGLP